MSSWIRFESVVQHPSYTIGDEREYENESYSLQETKNPTSALLGISWPPSPLGPLPLRMADGILSRILAFSSLAIAIKSTLSGRIVGAMA
jgi:hypothetical protein